jgi:hypothetical protein
MTKTFSAALPRLERSGPDQDPCMADSRSAGLDITGESVPVQRFRH